MPLLFHTRAHMRPRFFRRNTLSCACRSPAGFRPMIFRSLVVGTLPSRGLWPSGFRDVVKQVRRIGQASAQSSGSGEGPGIFRQSSRSPERLRLIALLGSPARRYVRRFDRFRLRRSWRSVRQVLGSPAIRHLAPGDLPAGRSGHRNPVPARSSRSSD